MNFGEAIERVLGHEGGLVDNKADPATQESAAVACSSVFPLYLSRACSDL